jgi:uncharacterized C2H2 Zn-finger protein
MTQTEDRTIGHCIVCGKAYKYWKWFTHHYNKEHPWANERWGDEHTFPMTIRVKEVADAMNEEAKQFLKSKIDWSHWK